MRKSLFIIWDTRVQKSQAQALILVLWPTRMLQAKIKEKRDGTKVIVSEKKGEEEKIIKRKRVIAYSSPCLE